MRAYKEFADRVEPVAVHKLNKSDRVRAVFDKRLGKLAQVRYCQFVPRHQCDHD